MRGALVLLAVVGCKSGVEPPKAAPAPAPAPAKPAETVKVLHQASVKEGFVVIVPKGGDATAIAKQMQERLAASKLDGGVAAMEMPPMKPEDRKMVSSENPDLTPADLDGILSGSAIAVSATGEPVATLRALAPIVHDAAVKAHGWVLDPLAGGMYTAARFAKHVPGDVLDVRTQIFVHQFENAGEDPALDTMGMKKLGFPELSMSVVATGHVTQAAKLINAVAQTLLAQPDLPVPGTIYVDLGKLPGHWYQDEFAQGATGHAQFHMAWRKSDGGEDEIELTPAKGSGTEALESVVAECFGAEPDVPTPVKANDAELVAAARRARSELSAMRAHFVKGVPFKEQLSIKAPFSTDDGRVEWMWVDVVKWTGDTLEGTLANDPDVVKTLKAGAHVKVPFAKLADFIQVLPDGTRRGGYSIEVFKKRGLVQ